MRTWWVVATAFALAGCGGAAEPTFEGIAGEDPGPIHVHGLGLDPADVGWADGGGAETESLRSAVDALIAGLLEDRATARADKDWARADAIRDRIKAAGIEIEDTPSGPKWSI